MKKLIIILMFMAGMHNAIAQNATTTNTDSKSKKTRSRSEKNSTEKTVENKTADNRAATGLNKNGTPDMRLKVNKEARAKQNNTASYPAQPQNNATTSPSVSALEPRKPIRNNSNVNNAGLNSDKVFGQDNKGRTIYEGPRGGHYYINSKGNKEYVKKGQ